jgi:hypothetical protein
MGPYFHRDKGIRQGDHMSPLFNMVAEWLTKMMLQARSNGLVISLASDFVQNGLEIL